MHRKRGDLSTTDVILQELEPPAIRLVVHCHSPCWFHISLITDHVSFSTGFTEPTSDFCEAEALPDGPRTDGEATSHACNLRVSESEVSLTCTDGFLSTISRFLLMVRGFDVWDTRAFQDDPARLSVCEGLAIGFL